MIGVLAVGLVAGLLFVWRRTQSRAPVGDSALAVLPFENDGDTSNAYFADGITDEIRGKLTALPALRVIARASSNQYRRTDKSPQQIGRELGAMYLLTGVERWETSPKNAWRVRVSPELVQISRESAPRTIWQQTYDTTLADVFQVQSSVASKVAANLGVVLNAPAKAQLAALERALRLAPSSVDVLRTLGQVEAGAGQWDQGLAHVRQATALDPRSTRARRSPPIASAARSSGFVDIRRRERRPSTVSPRIPTTSR